MNRTHKKAIISTLLRARRPDLANAVARVVLADDEAARRHSANGDLQGLTKDPYFQEIPHGDIAAILRKHGFDPEAVPKSYAGNEGRINEQVGDDTWLVLTWYRMESGRFEVVTYLHGTKDEATTKVMGPVETERARRGQASKDLVALTHNTYFSYIPLDKIEEILDRRGFDSSGLGSRPYHTPEGRDKIQVGHKTWLVLTWYKMPSGKYEVVMYLS